MGLADGMAWEKEYGYIKEDMFGKNHKNTKKEKHNERSKKKENIRYSSRVQRKT